MLKTYLQWYGSGQLRSDPHKARLAHDARQQGYIIDHTQGGLYLHKALIAPPPKPFVQKPVPQPSLKDYIRRAGRGMLQAGQDYLTGVGQQSTAFPIAQAHGAASLLSKAAAGIDRMRHHPGAAGQWDAYAKRQRAQMVGALYGPRHDKSAIARTLGSVPADLADIANGLFIQAPAQAQQEKMKALAGLYNLYAAGGSALVGHKQAARGHLRAVGAIGSQIYNDELTSSGLNPAQPSILTDSATGLGFYAGGNPNNMGGQYGGHIGRNVGQFTTEHPVQQAMNVLSVVEPAARIVPFARAGLARLGGRLAEGTAAEAGITARHEVLVNPNAPKGKPYGVWDHQAPGTKKGDWVRTKQGFAKVYSTKAEAKEAMLKEPTPAQTGIISSRNGVAENENRQTRFGSYQADERARVAGLRGNAAADKRHPGGGSFDARGYVPGPYGDIESVGSLRARRTPRGGEAGRTGAFPKLRQDKVDSQIDASRGTPVGIINSHALELMRRWLPGVDGEIHGLTLSPAHAQAIIELLHKRSEAVFSLGYYDEAESFDKLAHDIRHVVNHATGRGIAFVSDKAPDIGRTIDHELVHAGQHKYGISIAPDDRLFPNLMRNRFYRNAHNWLTDRNPIYTNRGPAEVPAALVNHWEEMGLTKRQAVSLLADYLADIEQFHPNASVDILGHLTGHFSPNSIPIRVKPRLIPPEVPRPGGPDKLSTMEAAPKRLGAFSLSSGKPTSQAFLPPGFVPAMVMQTPGLENLYGLTLEQRRRLLERFWRSNRLG
jgi:hypothetical protein